MKYKGLFKTAAFLLLLIFTLSCLNQWYSIPQSYISRHMRAFEQESKNTVDGIVIGTSVVAYAWVPTVAYTESGVAAYHLGSNVQPFGATIPLIEYAKKTQDIKYAIIDIHGMRVSAIKNSCKSGNIKNLYCNIPNASARKKILNGVLDYVDRVYEYYGQPENSEDVVDRSDISYKIPFINLHNRWVDGLVKSDFTSPVNRFKGANDRKGLCFSSVDCTKLAYMWEAEPTEVDDFQKQELQRVFDYLEENNIKAVFINLPSFRKVESQQELAGLIAYCREKGYDTIDFSCEQMLRETGIKLDKDFVNTGHLNSSGAVKVSKYMARYLVENGYATEDHRGQEGYESWDKTAEEYQKFYDAGWKEAESAK